MKLNVFTLTQQAQEFVLRLFVEPGSDLSSSTHDYTTCSHCGTYSRLRQ